MSKLLKKTGALMLALAMVFTMIPFASVAAFAEDAEASVDNIEFCVNGEVKGYISREWLNENEMDEAQVFPQATKKEYGVVKYMIKQGVDLNKVFELFGYTEEQLGGSTIYLCEGTSMTGKNPLAVDHLIDSTRVMKGAWDTENSVDGRKFIKVSSKRYAEVTPILCTRVSASTYLTYDAACDALDSIDDEGFWSATKTSLAIGNSGDAYEGLDPAAPTQIDDPKGSKSAIDCNARYSINNFVRINIVTPVAESMTLDQSQLTFNKDAAQKVNVSFDPAGAAYTEPVVWSSDNEKIAKVDANGKVTPTGIGTCVVKAACGDLEETVDVTVNKVAFTPARVSGLKASNKYTRTASLSWTKVSKASGYVVAYKKSGAKSWSVKPATTKSAYSVKSLTKGKKYSFKVKAYRTVNGKKVYGAYSAIKTITIKK